ncbi:MAG TPA: hypothetical protein VF928_09190 [Usitatibacteraceae bacterium]
MARLFTSLLAAAGASATSQLNASYAATNALTQSLARPWKSATLVAEYLEIDLGADALIRGVIVHGANFTAMRVDTVTNAGATTAGGADTLAANRSGRVRGLSYKGAGGVTGRRIRIYPSGATTDGAASWSIGAVHSFGVVTALPEIPYEQDFITAEPAFVVALPNRRMAAASVAQDIDMISLPFEIGDTQTVSALIQNARNGVCGLDMQLSNYPAAIWPVIRIPTDAKQTAHAVKRTKEPIELLEVC